MPNDPTLSPSVPDPLQRVYERLQATEARLQALERHRDVAITTVRNSGTFHWSGGRVWLLALGNVTSGGSGLIQVLVSAGGTNVASAVATATASGQSLPLIFQAAQFNPATYGAFPGDDLMLTTSATGTGAGGARQIDMLVIEWPQA